MSSVLTFGRKVKQRTQAPKIEETPESKRVRELMEEVEDSERFFSIMLSNLQKSISLSKNEIEGDLQFFEMLKTQGDEWKKEDFEIGAFMSKVSLVGCLVENMKSKYNEQLTLKLCDRMSNFINVEVKEARLMQKKYEKMHLIYQHSIDKVKMINQSSKVVLSKLQEAEAQRDQLKEMFEKTGKMTMHHLTMTIEKSKCDLMSELAELMEAMMEFHNKASKTLEKMIADVQTSRSYADKKREQLKKLEEGVPEMMSKKQWTRVSAKPSVVTARPASLTRAVGAPSLSAVAPIEASAMEIPEIVKFEVTKSGRKPERQTFILDIEKRILSIHTDKTGEKYDYPLDKLLQLVPSRRQPRQTKLRWQGREEKLDRYNFLSILDRDRFHEAYWFAKLRQVREVILSTRQPVVSRDLKVFCGTWNAGDAPPPYDVPLDSWIPKDQCDIYAVAFQECDYSPRESYISCEDDCFSWIGSHLGGNYLKLAGVSLWSIRIVVFVRRELYYYVTRLKTSTVATGLAKVIGNKGGSGVAFDLFDTRLCFIGSHLAARIDRRRMELRNQHYRDIMKDLNFSDNGDNHHEFDHVFWMGDLNYRIEMPRDTIIKLCEQKDWPTLLKHDQLNNERAAENSFLDFEEQPIQFLPTYRFNRGDRTWSEEKMREPAWCDRVLWKSVHKGRVRGLEYNCCNDIMSSDHSPVYAILSLSVDYPYMPHAREACKIVVTNLRGFELKGSPYVTFQANFLESSTSTPSVERTINPIWFDADVPVLVPTKTSREFLARQWVRIVVRDKGDGSTLGQGVIYLENACGAEPAFFSTRLVDKGRVSGRIEGRIQVQWPDRTPDTSLTAVYGRPGLLSSLSNIEKGRSVTLLDANTSQDNDPSKVHKRIITPPKIAPLGLTRTATEPSTSGSPQTSPTTSPRAASSPRPVLSPTTNPDSPRNRIGTRGVGLSPPSQATEGMLSSPRTPELAQLGPPSNPDTPNLSPKPTMIPRPSLTHLAENVLSSDNIDEIDALVEGESEMSRGFDEDLDYASIIDSIDDLVMKSPALSSPQTQFEMTNSVDIPVNNNNNVTNSLDPMANSPSTEDDDDEVIEVIPASKRTYTISLNNSAGSGNNTPLSSTPSNALPIPGAEERRTSINRATSMQFSTPPSTASPESPEQQPKSPLIKSQSQKSLPRSIIGHSPANSAPTNPLTNGDTTSNNSSMNNSPSTPTTGRLVLGRQRDRPSIAVHPPGPGQPQNGNTQ
jgi:hypothetical protein